MPLLLGLHDALSASGATSREVRDDLVAAVADDDEEPLGVEAAGRGEHVAEQASGRTTSCSTLGVLDFIRVPSPAARTMTAAGRGTGSRGSSASRLGRGRLHSRTQASPSG